MQGEENKAVRHAKSIGLNSSRFTAYDTISESAQEKIERIKRKDRSYINSLNEWQKSGYAKSDVCQNFLKAYQQYENTNGNENSYGFTPIDNVSYNEFSEEEFAQKYLATKTPVLINGIYNEQHVQNHWSFQSLYENYKDVEFKCGEDDDGHKLRIKLKYYLEYLIHNEDDSPLYLFESALEENEQARAMIKNFDVPKYFTEDFFKYAGEKRRPPYRWFLIGPERSGSTVHQDPLSTDAWNTSFTGYKLWVCFPNRIPKAIVKGKQYRPPTEDDEAINYFAKMLPEIIKNEGAQNLGVMKFVQKPGQTVYVPGGWWHAVLNLTDTIAVTQNCCHSQNLDVVWRAVRSERKRFACYLLKKLQKQKPEIAQRCIELNRTEKFIMHDYEQYLLKKRKSGELEFSSAEIQALELIKKKKKYSVNSSSASSSSSSSSSSSEYSTRSPIDMETLKFGSQRELPDGDELNERQYEQQNLQQDGCDRQG